MQLSLKPNLSEYDFLFQNMQIDESKNDEIKEALNKIKSNENRYQSLVNSVNNLIPWYAVGIAHYMEADCDFNCHIHNGDSLEHRTIHEPKNRPSADPINGIGKPYTWEESCKDWLILKGWNRWKDWEAHDILARLELNNGIGYRKYNMATPYLWGYTNWYTEGKFVEDGKFDKEAVSKQVGAAILLKNLI